MNSIKKMKLTKAHELAVLLNSKGVALDTIASMVDRSVRTVSEWFRFKTLDEYKEYHRNRMVKYSSILEAQVKVTPKPTAPEPTELPKELSMEMHNNIVSKLTAIEYVMQKNNSLLEELIKNNKPAKGLIWR
jgi:hypothetical protein